MPLESLELTVVLPGSPERIYQAWLDSTHHAAFTGGTATIEAVVGGRHSVWDGYISGKNVALEAGRRILQTWRTTEFPEDAIDSNLELLLELVEGGTRMVLKHTSIPEGQAEQYEEGWKEYYFDPMLEYFTNLAVSPAVVGAVRVVAPTGKAEPATKKKPAVKQAVTKKAVSLKKKSPPPQKKVVPVAKKTAAKKAPAKKAPAKKAPAKKAAKKSPAKKK